MKSLHLRAAPRVIGLIFAFVALAACTDMGAGSDPKESEGTFLFELPFELKPSEIKPKDAEEASDDGGLGADDESAAPPAKEEEPPQEDTAQELTEEPAVAPAPLPEDTPPDESALAEGSSDERPGALPAIDEPIEEGIAVSRYSLYMVSATGFRQEEEAEPSEEAVKVTAQAGRWKIIAVAEGLDGEAVAACELTGVALSAGEERAVALEWEEP